MQLIQDALEAARLQNWYALASLALMLAVQVLRKQPHLRDKIWNKIPDGLRFLVPLAGGAVAAYVGAYLNGAGLIDALNAAVGGALTIGLGSMGGAAMLRESPISWDGGAGGKPKDPPSDPPGGDQTPVAAKPIPVVLPRGPGLSMLALAFVLSGCGFGAPNVPDEACPDATRVATVECPALAVAGCEGKPWAECAAREQIEAECHKRIDVALEACE
jgi:hypothetical protein